MSANAEGVITGKERAESSTAKIRVAIKIYDKFAATKSTPTFAKTTADIFCLCTIWCISSSKELVMETTLSQKAPSSATFLVL